MMKKFALISAMLFFIVYFWANTFMPEDDSIVGIYPVVAANPVAESNVVDEALLNRIMEAESPSDALDYSGTETPSEAEGDYYLIVASFSDPDQASQVAEKYKNDFDVEMIVLPPTPQGYYRISYGRYTTSEEAGATLPAVREKINSDAWIFNLN